MRTWTTSSKRSTKTGPELSTLTVKLGQDLPGVVNYGAFVLVLGLPWPPSYETFLPSFTKILLGFLNYFRNKSPMNHFNLYSQINFTKILCKSKRLVNASKFEQFSFKANSPVLERWCETFPALVKWSSNYSGNICVNLRHLHRSNFSPGILF